MPRSNDKSKIIEHYDVASPYYRSLWGEHIHHGYWIRGDESKETAQLQLIEYLASLAHIREGCEVLDIGCGFGASGLFLARRYGVIATGITISPVQVEMANHAAAVAGARATFMLMDAEAMQFGRQFDLLWSVESISHYENVEAFFISARKFIKPGGTFALTDWFKRENLSSADTRRLISPIEKGMFVELQTMDDYARYLTASGLHITHREALTRRCAKTWDLSLDIIKDKSLWVLAAKYGPDFISYLKGFQAMRAGYASGAFVYGLFVAVAPPAAA